MVNNGYSLVHHEWKIEATDQRTKEGKKAKPRWTLVPVGGGLPRAT